MTTPLNPKAFLAAKDAAREAVQADADWHDVTTAMLTAYLAVTQPVVNTVEELDALPNMSVVLDTEGAACQLNGYGIDGCYWESMGETDLLTSEIPPPARVLHRPEES